MRTQLTARSRNRRLAVGLALAAPVLAVALGGLPAQASPAQPPAAPGTTATPTPTTPAPDPTKTPPTVDPTESPAATAPKQPPAKKAAKGVDATVVITAEKVYKPGSTDVVKFSPRSTKPATGYVLTVKFPNNLPFFEAPKTDGWDCAFLDALPSAGYSCKYKSTVATTSPGDVWLAFRFPKANKKWTVSATVKVAEMDTNPSNDTVSKKLVVGKAATGAIRGRVWNDANRNGRQDAGEKNIAGAKVVLFYADFSDTKVKSKIVARATTGADGRYAFRGLAATTPDVDTYAMSMAAPSRAWRFTEKNVGNENGNNDFEAFNRKGEPLTGEEARLFGRNAIVGLDDRLPVTAGKTIVEDAGLYKLAGATAPNKPASNGAAQNAAGSLPVTGAAAGGLLGAGALLLAGGGVLLLVARRRRPVTSPTE